MSEVVHQLEDLYEAAARQADANKDSGQPMAAVEVFVAGTRGSDRAEVERALCEWAEGDDDPRQFTALAVIDRLRIASAIPTLRKLAARFEGAHGPSAPYDWAKVNRILGRLQGPAEPRCR